MSDAQPITAPDGSVVYFPTAMSDDQIAAVMAKEYPHPQTTASQGPRNPLIENPISQGLSYATGGLSDKAAAGEMALGRGLGLNVGVNAPTFGERFQKNNQNIANERGGYASQNPNIDTGARAAGAVAPMLAMGASEAPTLASSLKTGGLLGAGYGFGGSDLSDPSSTAADVLSGAGLGAVAGGGGHLAGNALGSLLGSASESAAMKGIPKAQRQAYAKLLSHMEDQGITPASVDAFQGSSSKPLTIMDMGGANTPIQRLGRMVATAPGNASSVVTDFLDNRGSDQAPRVIGDISGNLAQGQTAQSNIDGLIAGRKAAAKPMYEAAGIPSDPAQFAAAPNVDTPAVNDLIKNSANVRSAISQAKRNSAYAGLPSNSMVMLDQAYKNIGGAANEAARAGNGTKAFALNNERSSLLDAITGGDANHPYRTALSAYSGPSQSLDAISNGQDFLKSDPEELPGILKQLSPQDQQFYKIGAAKALQDKVNSAGDNADVVKRIYGNPTIRRQIGAVFGQGSLSPFGEAMGQESQMSDVGRFVTSGSNTANKAADLAADSHGSYLEQALPGAVAGGLVGGPHGALAGGILAPAANYLKGKASTLAASLTSNQPRNLVLARMLTQTGPNATGLSAELAPALAAKERAKQISNYGKRVGASLGGGALGIAPSVYGSP